MKNVGMVDRLVRLVVGLGVLSLVFWGPKTPWAWLGLIPLATAALATCPLYSVLGMRTCARETIKHSR
ncbi:MAG: DUF2892 domain-containing protein [Fibrobacteria bacterium]